jgi:hypothetical protein
MRPFLAELKDVEVGTPRYRELLAQITMNFDEFKVSGTGR